jgi:hypothetical protein
MGRDQRATTGMLIVGSSLKGAMVFQRHASGPLHVLTVSRRLGHNKPSVTLDIYGHLIEGADAAEAKAIEGVLK